MASSRPTLRDWHRLFGLLLTDYFTGSPFIGELEKDLSVQQQFLDVVIVRRRRGRFTGRLADGLEDLAAHNLITFKSHHEALDAWAIKELVGHAVAYRKLVSHAPSELLPEEQFRLYAVCARSPQKLAQQVPWHQRQPGVYDCTWGTDTIRVVVAGELPRAVHNAPLHVISASAELVNFGGEVYEPRSEKTSLLLRQLFEGFQEEGLDVSYTMADFEREYMKKHLPKLTPQERAEVLQALPPEERLAGLSEEQIRRYLDQVASGRRASSRRPRRKK
jgi:hypothetical protein